MHEKPILEVPEDAKERAAGFVGRRWVLDEISGWLGDRAERYLMLLGEPGAGKTALAAWLVGSESAAEDPAAPDGLATVRGSWDAVHFCNVRSGGGTVSPHHFAASIFEQLAVRYEAFAAAAMDRLALKIDIHQYVQENRGSLTGLILDRLIINDRDAEDAYNRVVREPLRELATAEPGVIVNILVNALDEGYTAAQPNIVSLIARSDDFPPGVRFLVTSRAEPRVTDQFGSIRKIDLSDPRHAVASSADLLAYVSNRVLLDERLRVMPSAEAETFREQLVARAAGNFLYAKLVLDEMAAGRRAVGDVTALPERLYGLYREFLDRLVPQATDRFSEAWEEKHEPFLGCLTVATPAAPEETLPAWLGWTQAKLNVHIENTAQLIEYVSDLPHKLNGYRFSHSSMADFLTKARYDDGEQSRSNKYYIDPVEQHSRIASYYLQRIGEEWAGDWARSDAYGLLHLPTHILGSGDDKTLLKLINAPFLSAKTEQFASYAMILKDMLIGMEAAERQGDLAALLRLGLAFVGIKQRVESLPPGAAESLLSLYAAAGHADRAVDLARMIDKDWLRAVVMRAIVEILAETDQELATQIANQIDDDPLARAESLEKVLDVIKRDAHSPSSLGNAAAHLLTLVNQIEPRSDWEQYWHVSILRRIADKLSVIDPEISASITVQAITEARIIDYHVWRYEKLIELAATRSGAGDHQEALKLYGEALAAAEEGSDQGWAGEKIGEVIAKITILDLNWALRMATAVTHVVGKPYALAYVAHQLAKIDAKQARSLIDEAIVCCRMISFLSKAEAPRWREKAMARIGWALAALDFDAGIGLSEENARDQAFSWIATDPVHSLDRALSTAARIDDLYSRNSAFATIALTRAAVNAREALGILAEVTDLADQCRARTQVAVEFTDGADSDFGSIIDATALLAIGDPDRAAPLLAEIGSRISTRDPERAAALCDRALARVTTSISMTDQLNTYSEVARQYIATGNRGQAADVVRQALKSVLDIRDQRWARQSRALLLGKLACHDFDQALMQASQLPADAEALALVRVVETIAGTDLPAARRLFQQLEQRFTQVDAVANHWRELEVRSAMADALAALLVASARCGSPDTTELAERLWHYEGDGVFMDLKCDALAKAGGVVAAHNLDAADHLLRKVLPERWGDAREVGRALAGIAEEDAPTGCRLAEEAASAYMKSRHGDPDEDLCAMCEELAASIPDLALELSSRAQFITRSSAKVLGYRSKVISRAAVAVSGSDLARAETLIEQAINDARKAQPDWLKVDALLYAAAALTMWNPAAADRVVADALVRARMLPSNAWNSQYVARAAAVTAQGVHRDEAILLMTEAIDTLQANPDTTLLEKIAYVLGELPPPIASTLTPRLLQAVLKGSDLLLEQLTVIIPLLADADARGPSDAISAFLDEFVTALDIVEKVFVG